MTFRSATDALIADRRGGGMMVGERRHAMQCRGSLPSMGILRSVNRYNRETTLRCGFE